MKGFYAEAGERVTCELGHPICTFAKDVAVRAVPTPMDFFEWKIAEPKQGTGFPLRCQCGRAYMKEKSEGGILVFVEGEWRDEDYARSLNHIDLCYR